MSCLTTAQSCGFKRKLSALRELHGAEPDGSLVIIMRPNGKLIKMAKRAGVVHDVI